MLLGLKQRVGMQLGYQKIPDCDQIFSNVAKLCRGARKTVTYPRLTYQAHL